MRVLDIPLTYVVNRWHTTYHWLMTYHWHTTYHSALSCLCCWYHCRRPSARQEIGFISSRMYAYLCIILWLWQSRDSAPSLLIPPPKDLGSSRKMPCMYMCMYMCTYMYVYVNEVFPYEERCMCMYMKCVCKWSVSLYLIYVVCTYQLFAQILYILYYNSGRQVVLFSSYWYCYKGPRLYTHTHSLYTHTHSLYTHTHSLYTHTHSLLILP